MYVPWASDAKRLKVRQRVDAVFLVLDHCRAASSVLFPYSRSFLLVAPRPSAKKPSSLPHPARFLEM